MLFCRHRSSSVAKLILGVAAVAFLPCSGITASAQQSSNEKTIQLVFEGKSYLVSYNFTNGGSIDSVAISDQTVNMRISLTAQSDGDLRIRIPREISDISLLTVSAPLTLFANGVPVYNTEIPLMRSCEQTSFVVPVKANYTQIELVGAVIPDFGLHYPVDVSLSKIFMEEGRNFTVNLRTDAKKCDSTFSKEEKKIHFDIEGRNEATTDHGKFEIWVPHELLNGNYSVIVDGRPVTFKERHLYSTSLGAGSQSYLQFNYTKNATRIDILGTTAIPEFDTLIVSAAIPIVAILFITRARR